VKNRFYKILSIILSVSMLLSVCGVVANAADTAENAYYVMSGGTGDGRSEASPLATVAEAIALINEDGLDADDTATVYVMQRSDWDAVTNADGTWNLTSWVEYGGAVPTHTATVIVQGYGTKDKWGNINLAFHNMPGKAQAMMIMGPTVFEDVMIVCPRYDYDAISLNGNSATFGSAVKYMRLNGGVWKGTEFTDNENTGYPGLSTTMGNHGANETYTNPVNIVLNNKNTGSSKARMFYLGAIGQRTHTYTEDVTITVNNSSTTPYIVWGNFEGNGGVTFEKNLNFNIISAAAVNNTLNKDNAKAVNTPIAVNGGIQILLNSADAWVVDISTFSNVNAVGGIFKLLNKTGVDDVLSFTDKAGVYKIKEGYFVAAYDADGKEYPCANGYLTVPAGEYTVKDYTPPVTNDYYVINGGTGNGKTADTPAGSVAEVINTINDVDNLGEGDTANIWIMQREDWNYATVEGSDATIAANNMTYWAKDGEVAADHEAEIVIQAYDATTTTYLALTDVIKPSKPYVEFTGPTTTKNITLVSTKIYYFQMGAAGNDLTIGAETKWGDNGNWDDAAEKGVIRTIPAISLMSAAWGKDENISTEQNIVIENELTSGSGYDRAIFIGNRGGYTANYAADVNLTIDNANSKPSIYWGNYSSQGKATFNGNINVNIKSANTVTNEDGWGTTTLNGGVQIINSGAAWSGDVTSFVDTSKGYWYLNNTTKSANLIDFTATAGTFSVREGYAVTATNDATGATTASADGKLVLAAGNYTLTAEKLPETVNYYVKNGATGDGRSMDAPAATVYDAIVSVNEDGLIAGDTAIINIMQRSDWNASKGVPTGPVSGIKNHEMTSWTKAGGNVPAHTATVVVQAYNTALDTYLVFSERLGANDAMGMNGPTVFKNIRIVGNRGIYNAMWLNGKDVTFGEGTKYGTLEVIATGSSDNTWDGTVKNQTSLAMYTVNYGDSVTVKDEVTYTFENEYVSKNGNTNHGVRFSGHNGHVVYDKDVNFIMNNDTAAVQMYFGNGNSGSTTINGNLNVVVRQGNGWTMTEGKAPVTINGNVQIIVNGAPYSGGNITDFSNVTLAETSKYWLVQVNTTLADALSLTDTDGSYKVIDGYVAVATDEKGNQTISKDGVLTISEGVYTVEVVTDYTNDGEVITVYNDGTVIDLRNMYHATKENKLFVGWKTADGEYANLKSVYSLGDKLYAEFIDFDASAFFIEEAQIRTEGDTGLRFVVNYNKQAVSVLPEISKYGTIALPLDLSLGRELFLDTPVVLTWQWDETDKNNFTAASTGATPVEVVADNILEESDTNVKYTLCITDIEAEKYNTFYAVRGYIQFTDFNGVDGIIYTENAQSSLYKVASEAIAAGEENAVYDEIVDYVENTWAPEYLANDGAITEYLAGLSSTVDTNPNHYMYRLSNGLVVRDVTVNSGIASDPIEIAFMADSHFNYVNEYDIATKSINALSSYRGRSWLRDGSSITRSLKAMKYASTFDKIVIGGDAIDYLSWGSQAVTENIFTKQSVNNNVLMAIGNHEIAETMQADISGLDDVMTLTERYNRIQKSWTNDVYYHEEIIDNKIMTIVLDNGNGDYWDSQIEPLKASIAKAREKGLKILIFQHIPMLTWNPNETSVYFLDGINTDKFGTSTNYSDVWDMTSYHGYMGGNSCDAEATLEICKIIRQSSDVIAGVFNGHAHGNMYTEIVALDENGNTLYDDNGNMVVIPQHTVAGVHYGGMMKITVK